MILDHAHDLNAFRAAVGEWVRDTIGNRKIAPMSRATGAETVEIQKWWMAERAKVGLAAAHWPSAYGGADLTLAHQIIISDEFIKGHAPPSDLFMISLNQLPGTLIPCGTEEQKCTHLARAANGTIWCQGFSEPDAGSDLASLRCRAIADGDSYRVTGQKIWSSFSAYADWCILLVRTDFDASKHKGITFLLLDMKSPGVEVRPIKKSTGSSMFSEIFLNDVVIPKSNRVGAENAGWAVAQATLSSERGVVVFEGMERLQMKLQSFYRDSVERSASWLDDDALRREFMVLFGELQALRRQVRNVIAASEHGAALAEWSVSLPIIKLVSSSLRQRIGDHQTRALGLGGQVVGSDAGTGVGMYDYLDSYGFTISAGSNEIMRNLIAERGLGLPRT